MFVLDKWGNKVRGVIRTIRIYNCLEISSLIVLKGSLLNTSTNMIHRGIILVINLNNNLMHYITIQILLIVEHLLELPKTPILPTIIVMLHFEIINLVLTMYIRVIIISSNVMFKHHQDNNFLDFHKNHYFKTYLQQLWSLKIIQALIQTFKLIQDIKITQALTLKFIQVFKLLLAF